MIKSKDEIVEDLRKLSDEEYKIFHSGLSPEVGYIIGVRVPILKQYAKDLLKEENWEESYRNIGTTFNEEKMLKGIMIGFCKKEAVEKIEMLKEFVPTINSWSSCDTTCATLKFANKNQELVWAFLNNYIESDKEFETRFALVMYLEYFINDEYVQKVLEKINLLNRQEYYVKMAAAWAISVVIVKYPKIRNEIFKRK